MDQVRGTVLFTSWTSTMTYNFYCLISVYELSPIYRRNFKTNSFKGKKRVLLKVCTELFTQGCKLRSWKQWGEERFESMSFEIV